METTGEALSTHRATQTPDERSTCNRPGIGRLVLRHFDPQRDSWERLTQLLHRAFTRLASLGLHCASADQAASATRARALAGDCFVAVCNGRIVGTMTIEGRDGASPCEHYRQHGVARCISSVSSRPGRAAASAARCSPSRCAGPPRAASRGSRSTRRSPPRICLRYIAPRVSVSWMSCASRGAATTALCSARPQRAIHLRAYGRFARCRAKQVLASHVERAAFAHRGVQARCPLCPRPRVRASV